jgi:hypothetical protein
MWAYLVGVADERRQQPAEDLVSVLANVGAHAHADADADANAHDCAASYPQPFAHSHHQCSYHAARHPVGHPDKQFRGAHPGVEEPGVRHDAGRRGYHGQGTRHLRLRLTHGHGQPVGQRDRHPIGQPDRQRDGHAHGNRYRHGNANAQPHANAQPYADAHSHANAQPHANAHGNADAQPHANALPGPNAHPGP